MIAMEPQYCRCLHTVTMLYKITLQGHDYVQNIELIRRNIFTSIPCQIKARTGNFVSAKKSDCLQVPAQHTFLPGRLRFRM